MESLNSDQLIERIVSGVLSQLGSARNGVPQTNGEVGKGPALEASPPAAASETAIQIDDAVITAAVLVARQVDSGTILLRPRSVLTPSAREYLKRKKIECRRAESAESISITGVKWLAIVAKATPAVVAALETARKEADGVWQQEGIGCHREAATRAVSALCRGECDGTVLFTAKPEAAACLANRNSAVRGAVVADAARIQAVASQLGANLFAIDPSDRTAFQLGKLLREIARGGKPSLPCNWNS